MLGFNYLYDFVKWELQEEKEVEIFKSYIADILRASIQWEEAPPRYTDIITSLKETKPKQSDKRTADEIKRSIVNQVNQGRGNN